MKSPTALFAEGINNLKASGIEVDVSADSDIGCNLEVISFADDLKLHEVAQRMDDALTSTEELAKFWRPVLKNYSPARQKKSDLYALTERLLRMSRVRH